MVWIDTVTEPNPTQLNRTQQRRLMSQANLSTNQLEDSARNLKLTDKGLKNRIGLVRGAEVTSSESIDALLAAQLRERLGRARDKVEQKAAGKGIGGGHGGGGGGGGTDDVEAALNVQVADLAAILSSCGLGRGAGCSALLFFTDQCSMDSEGNLDFNELEAALLSADPKRQQDLLNSKRPLRQARSPSKPGSRGGKKVARRSSPPKGGGGGSVATLMRQARRGRRKKKKAAAERNPLLEEGKALLGELRAKSAKIDAERERLLLRFA